MKHTKQVLKYQRKHSKLKSKEPLSLINLEQQGLHNYDVNFPKQTIHTQKSIKLTKKTIIKNWIKKQEGFKIEDSPKECPICNAPTQQQLTTVKTGFCITCFILQVIDACLDKRDRFD